MKTEITPCGLLPDGRQARLFTLVNADGMALAVSDYGCTIHSLLVPDRNGKLADVVTGYRNWEDWIENPAYFGCVVGRTCNRIGGARFMIDGREFKVSANVGVNQLHGGFEGFNRKLWDARMFEEQNAAGVEFRYLSVDGEEGFPGNLSVKAIFRLTESNEVKIEFHAETDRPTPVNLTNHAYFNLAGENSGPVYNQVLHIQADAITETDEEHIPTGGLTDVTGTAFDFREPHPIGERINQLHMGYDDNFVLNDYSGKLARRITAFDPGSGRVLEISTTEPGVQLYTSNCFNGSMVGKSGKPYLKHEAFALETQHFPDSMNQPAFPSVIIRPGEKYFSQTVWRFSTRF